MPANLILREDWYDGNVDESGVIIDPVFRQLTFYSLDHPTRAGHVVEGTFFGNGGYAFNLGPDDLPEYVIDADAPLYVPPGVADAAAWRENIRLNVLPYLELHFGGTSQPWVRLPWYDPYGALANDWGSSFDIRLTGTATDHRTGAAYDWDYRNHPNDFPFAFTLVARWAGVAGKPRPAQWFHAYSH
jgi:hypothetical protein